MRLLAAILSALPDFALAGVFLITWIDPREFGDRTVRYLVMVMLLEFIIIHSAGFMAVAATSDASRASKAKAILALGLFYSLFAGTISLGARAWWPFTTFWLLMLNRLLPVLLGAAPTEKQKEMMRAVWASAAVLYIVLGILTVLIPLPALGITSQVVDDQDLLGNSDEPGIWQRQPHRAIAFGFLYFAFVGLVEMSAAWGAIAEMKRGD